jgi:hypothetical protein
MKRKRASPVLYKPKESFGVAKEQGEERRGEDFLFYILID